MIVQAIVHAKPRTGSKGQIEMSSSFFLPAIDPPREMFLIY
jgi:hypothetical protein